MDRRIQPGIFSKNQKLDSVIQVFFVCYYCVFPMLELTHRWAIIYDTIFDDVYNSQYYKFNSTLYKPLDYIFRINANN